MGLILYLVQKTFEGTVIGAFYGITAKY